MATRKKQMVFSEVLSRLWEYHFNCCNAEIKATESEEEKDTIYIRYYNLWADKEYHKRLGRELKLPLDRIY